MISIIIIIFIIGRPITTTKPHWHVPYGPTTSADEKPISVTT